MRAKGTLLSACVAALVLSLAAALLLTGAPQFLAEHRTLYTLDFWTEKTFFWVGLILLGGFVLERVLPIRPDR